MAGFFRSISIKIFGVAVGLLVIMAAAALWSASLTTQVHLQLQTLSRSLFPLAMTLSELHIATQAQQLHAETALDTGDLTAERGCRATAEA
jgi:CHASE3 domain sensor protein